MQGKSERTTFRIAAGLARHRSPFFAHALSSVPVSATLGKHGLHISAEPQVFKLFLSWLYRGSFDYDEDHIKHFMAGSAALLDADKQPDIHMPLIHLWLLAESLKVPALANLAVDKMLVLADASRPPSKGSIKAVYQASQSCVELRELMVHMWACFSNVVDTAKDVHYDFENALLMRLQEMVYSDKKRDSFKGSTARFHLPKVPPSLWPQLAHRPQETIDLVSDSEKEVVMPGLERSRGLHTLPSSENRPMGVARASLPKLEHHSPPPSFHPQQTPVITPTSTSDSTPLTPTNQPTLTVELNDRATYVNIALASLRQQLQIAEAKRDRTKSEQMKVTHERKIRKLTQEIEKIRRA